MYISNDEIEIIKKRQKKDFEIISTRADDNCPVCHGKGYQGFSLTDLSYIVCLCVLKNIEKELAENNVPEAQKQGILSKIRLTFGLN